MKIPDVPLDVWRGLYAAADEFKALKPWEHFDDGMLFGIQDAAAVSMGYACVLGALGELMALAVYRGAEGFDLHRRMQNNEFQGSPQDVVLLQNCLFAEFGARSTLAKPDHGVIRDLGLSFRGSKDWPLFRSHLPGCAPWHLSTEEASYLAFALRCARDVASRVVEGRLKLDAKPGHVFCYFPKPGRDFETRWEPEPVWRPLPPHPVRLDDARLARLKAIAKEDGAWEADAFALPSALTDRDRPYFPRCLLVAHQESGFIIHNEIVLPEIPLPQALADALLAAIENSGRMPGQIELRDESVAACLAPLGKALGARLKPGKLKMVGEARKEMEKFMRTGRLPAASPEPVRPKTQPRTGPRAAERALFDRAGAIRDRDFKSEAELDVWLERVAADEGLRKAAPRSALDVAQSVMYEAWEEDDPDRAIELAERALSISPDCADAYEFLAQEARTPKEELELYRKGVEAGERALGPGYFKENAGHFWGMLETRGYMRCRAGLAECLWAFGRHDECLAHFHEILRLNPSDNQGIRYLVLSRLGELGRFDELDEFMSGRYKQDCSADWLYTRLLMEFRREGGGSASAGAALIAALKCNKHVPGYITGRKPIPRRLPDRISLGGEDEGYCYAARFMPAWKRVPGAIEWLRAASDKARPRGAGRNEPCPCGSGRKSKKCCGSAAS
jgi:tetratricopeptide (TPR) repeat protein